MPSRNKLTVQRLYEALEARNFSAFLGLLSPDVHIVHSPGLPWSGLFQGHEGARMLFERMADYVTSYLSIERILDAGDSMAITGRSYGVTRRSRRRFDVPFVHLWELKDGLAIRVEMALDLPSMRVAVADAA